jgi:hypothetical protein
MEPTDLRRVLEDPVAEELYRASALLRLAYTARDGAPRVIPIGYVRRGTAFIVCTAAEAPKVRALQADRRVALTIDVQGPPPRCLLVRGTADVEIVDGVPEEMLEASLREVPPASHASYVAEVRRLYDRVARITITPSWAKVLDFERRVPSVVEELARRHGSSAL